MLDQSQLRGVLSDEDVENLRQRNEMRRHNAIVQLRRVGKYLLDVKVQKKQDKSTFH